VTKSILHANQTKRLVLFAKSMLNPLYGRKRMEKKSTLLTFALLFLSSGVFAQNRLLPTVALHEEPGATTEQSEFCTAPAQIKIAP
jgi:hypothetical protein